MLLISSKLLYAVAHVLYVEFIDRKVIYKGGPKMDGIPILSKKIVPYLEIWI